MLSLQSPALYLPYRHDSRLNILIEVSESDY